MVLALNAAAIYVGAALGSAVGARRDRPLRACSALGLAGRALLPGRAGNLALAARVARPVFAIDTAAAER